MDLLDSLHELEDLVASSSRFLLTNKCLVNEEELIRLISNIRKEWPSALKEAVLDSTLQELYILCDDNPKDAKIVLPKYKTDEDAAIIHRFACQKIAIKEFDNVSSYIHNYLKYMQEKNLDEDIYKMHLKFNFPTKEQFKNSLDAFLKISDELKPNVIFIWGYRLWQNLPKDNLITVMNINGTEKHLYNNIPIKVIPHPSSNQFNYELCNDIQNFLKNI